MATPSDSNPRTQPQNNPSGSDQTSPQGRSVPAEAFEAESNPPPIQDNDNDFLEEEQDDNNVLLSEPEQSSGGYRGMLPTRSNFAGVGLGPFTGVNATDYFLRYKEARALLRIPDHLALACLKGLVVSPHISATVNLFTSSARTWKEQETRLLQAFREYDIDQWYRPEQQLRELLQNKHITSHSSMIVLVYSYDKILWRLKRRQSEPALDFWDKLPSNVTRRIMQDYSTKRKHVFDKKWPWLMELLLQVYEDIQEEDEQDRKAAGYKANGGDEIIKGLSSYRATAPPTHRLMPPELEDANQNELPNYTGIYDEESYLAKPSSSKWAGTAWTGGTNWPTSNTPEAAPSTEPSTDASPSVMSKEWLDLVDKMQAWTLNNAKSMRDLNEQRRAIYEMGKAHIERLGQKGKKTTKARPRPETNNIQYQILQRPKEESDLLTKFVQDYEAEHRPGDTISVETDNEDADLVHINALRRDGTKMACYGCAMPDHNAWDCPMLKRLKSEGVLYYEDPGKTRFWLGNREETRQGISRPLDATMVALYRNTIGVAKYACGVLAHLLDIGVAEAWVSRYSILRDKNSQFAGDSKVAIDKTLYEAPKGSDQTNNSARTASSISIADTEKDKLDLSSGYSYPKDKIKEGVKPSRTVDQLEINEYGVKRRSQTSGKGGIPAMEMNDNHPDAPGNKKARIAEPERSEESDQTETPASSAKDEPAKDRKAKKPDLSDPSTIPNLVVSRFFSTPRGFTQDEIISMRPDFGDHIVEHVRSLQDGVNRVVYVGQEQFDRTSKPTPPETSSVNHLPRNSSTAPTGLINVQAVCEFFEKQRMSDAGPVVMQTNMVQCQEAMDKTVSELNATLDQMLEKCTAPTNLLPVRFGGPANKPLPALIDTGAMMNIISASVCDEFSLPYVTTSTSSSAFNGTSINIVGVMETDMYVAGCHDRVMFFVVDQEGINHEVLLGMPFFNQTKMTFTHTVDNLVKASFKFGGARLIATVGSSGPTRKPEQKEN